MTEPRFLTTDEILSMHYDLIEEFGAHLTFLNCAPKNL